jgi:putative membrane protein
MQEEKKDTKSETAIKCNNYLANERTFLAWIRTSIGIMAFGFVIEKFSLFLKQLSFLLQNSNFAELDHHPYSPPGYASIFGIIVVGLGVLIAVLSFIRYKRVESQINDNSYHPSLILDVMLTLLVFLIGTILIIYLIYTI